MRPEQKCDHCGVEGENVDRVILDLRHSYACAQCVERWLEERTTKQAKRKIMMLESTVQG